ncbi:hypothetical protein NXW48_11790 [Phocaeicola vulgatus]|nr:hypothetical protein [Phocaeicola vulgatus]
MIDNTDIQNTPDNIDTKGKLWIEREFSHPNEPYGLQLRLVVLVQ